MLWFNALMLPCNAPYNAWNGSQVFLVNYNNPSVNDIYLR